MNELVRELKEIIEDNEEIDLSYYKNFTTYWIHDEGYNREFRIAFVGDRIIISRVCFENRRRGCMTRCFESIKRYALENGIREICIQSVLTQEMMAWCLDNDFRPNIYCMKVDGVIIGDYIYEKDSKK